MSLRKGFSGVPVVPPVWGAMADEEEAPIRAPVGALKYSARLLDCIVLWGCVGRVGSGRWSNDVWLHVVT